MSTENHQNASPKIENTFYTVLGGEALNNALNFAAFLRANNMTAGGPHGEISYKDTCISYMHVNDATEMPSPWTIWTDGDYSAERADVPMDERMKELAWAKVNHCTSCGCGSQPGTRKTILGKTFDNVCNADMAFYMPDAETLECVKRLLEMRKRDIDGMAKK